MQKINHGEITEKKATEKSQRLSSVSLCVAFLGDLSGKKSPLALLT